MLPLDGPKPVWKKQRGSRIQRKADFKHEVRKNYREGKHKPNPREGVFMTTERTASAAAANKMNGIFSRKSVKETFAKLAEMGSSSFEAVLEGIHDINSMDDSQVREAVQKTFSDAKERLSYEARTINAIPSLRDSYYAENLEVAVAQLTQVEKELLAEDDINIVRKMLLMFWTGVKAIAGMILKSAVRAGKFVLLYGIRFLAVGADFIIRIIKKAVSFAKTVWRVVKAYRVANGTVTEDEQFEEELLEDEEK